jgi:hypothetical protein
MAASSSSSTPYLRLVAQHGDTSEQIIRLDQETGKKSSFLYHPTDEDEPLTIPKPAELSIDYPSSLSSPSSADATSTTIYFLGGFQIISNAKQAEVHWTDDKDGKEHYLTTSRGIPFEKDAHNHPQDECWYKAMCVVPGGPRPIRRLRIKLLSLQPKTITTARVKLFKLTARVPDLPTVTTDSAPNNKSEQPATTTTSAPPSSSSSGPTPANASSDLGAVMASVSIMARSAQSDIQKTLTDKFTGLDQRLQHQFNTLEQRLSASILTTMSTTTALEEQQRQQQKQQIQEERWMRMQETTNAMIQAQSEQIMRLLEQQHAMTQTVQDLQSELLTLRQDVLLAVVNNNNKKNEEEKVVAGHATNEKVTPPRQKTTRPPRPPPIMEEEPIERGIEHTLSNLQGGDDDEDEDDGDGDDVEIEDVDTLSKTASTTTGSTSKNYLPKPVGPEPLEEGRETIEVALLDDGGTEQAMHVVHAEEKKVEEPHPPPMGGTRTSSSSAPSLSNTNTIGHVGVGPKATPSFEDRNDKNDAKEAAEVDTPDKVELEVMATTTTGHHHGDHADENPHETTTTIQVLESTTADQHERSPAPDGSEVNLIEL